MLTVSTVPIYVRAQTASEYATKAAYLYHFAQAAEWPEQSAPNATSPIVIGVFSGDDEFLDTLKKTVAGKNAGSHPIFVRRVSSVGEMTLCQLLFMRSSLGPKRTETSISELGVASILLVGEDDNFLRLGGMINLALKNGTIRFEINQGALDRVNIHLGATLWAAAVGQRSTASEAASAVTAVSSGPAAEESRRLKFSTPPEYPELAKRMNIRGAAQVELTVARDGQVKDVRIIGGHPSLTDALVKAVKGWRYEPAPKESLVVVKFVFGP
jgi:TonB family protein